jgi:hypothetical protein
MSITRALGAALAVTFALGSVASLAAQTTYPSAKIKGRLQTQYYNFNHTTFAGDSGSSNFFIRRARIQADVAINEYINMVIQPSFEGGRAPSSSSCTGHLNPDSTVTTQCTNGNGSIRLRDAYMDVSFMKESAKTRFTVRLGQEKRPFGRYELTSSNNLPSIERGAGKGLPGLALSDHQNLYLQGGIYNGEGESLNDKNKRKSFGVRGTVDVIKRLNVGGSFFSHDNAVVAAGKDSSSSNTAWGADAAWSKPGEAGLYAVVDYMQGEDRTKAANNIRGVSVVGAYNIRLKSPTSWLYAVEPSFRFDLSDPNTASASNKDEITTITGVVGFYMSSKAQFRVGYDYQKSQAPGTTAVSGVRTSLAVNF